MRTIILFFLFIFSCNQKKKEISVIQRLDITQETDVSKSKYKVLKIDSISDVYLIYVLKFEKNYKIISKKNNSKLGNCRKIVTNESYDFSLKTEFSQKGINEHVSGTVFNGVTIWIEEDSIMSLHSTKNLKGLCYEK